MTGRPRKTTRLALEGLEDRRLLSVRASSPPDLKAGSHPLASRPAERAEAPAKTSGGTAAVPGQAIAAAGARPHTGYLVYRITNPTPFNDKLTPFSHVLVQARQPVPGQVYNVLYVAVRNGTAQTFDASSGFTVSFPRQAAPTPILTGDQQWKPGQEFVFYVLTKKYYPLPSVVTSGFVFNLNARSTAIPGPSGIFLRLKYNPAKFDRTLDSIVAYGQAPRGARGVRLGLPDTAIYEFVSAKTRRIDFGGYF